MANVCMLIAMIIWMIDLAVIFLTDNQWRNVGIVWVLLSVGCVFFGLALSH